MNKIKFLLTIFVFTNSYLFAQSVNDSITYVNLPEFVFVHKLYKADSIKFNEYKAYVFQKEYVETHFRSEIESGRWLSGIDLDTLTIKRIDSVLTKENIITEYRKFMQFRFREMFEKDSTQYDIKALRREEKDYWKEFDEKSKEWTIHKRDRQYYGYVNAEGDTIVMIDLIEFGDDPYNSKAKVNQSLVPAFTGLNHSYPYVDTMRYNLTTNKLSVNAEYN